MGQSACAIYRDNLNQNEIAEQIGVSRSAVSRMLTEARRLNIVEIHIHHPLLRDEGMEQVLTARFSLERAAVVETDVGASIPETLEVVGEMAASMLVKYLPTISVLGISWGTAVAATVEALPTLNFPDLQVVQIIGAVGSKTNLTDTPDLAVRAARKLGGRFRVLAAPMIVEDPAVAQSLLGNPTVREALEAAAHSDIALVGIGATEPSVNSLMCAGYATHEYVAMLRDQGVVGDVCGLYFSKEGKLLDVELHQRRIGISPDWLLTHYKKIVGVAVGEAKVSAILGALKGRLIGTLITDQATARSLLSAG